MSRRRIRVAVLGGGCAGIAAAEALTATEARRRRFEVTVYQQGFRLGGKGATGRDPRRGQRIEEHGLHIWMGFYRRAFRMMRRCFEEWRPPPETPIRTIETAFAPHDTSTTIGPATPGGGLDLWNARFPPRPGLPWDDDGDPVDWAAFAMRELPRFAKTAMRDAQRELAGGSADVRRRLGILGRLALVVSRGLVLDVLPGGSEGFDRIDHLDLRQWLRRHGATADEIDDAPLVRGLYNLAFAYPDGVAGYGGGQVAAGAGLKSLLLISATYRGAPFWRMRAGMGDTIFAPLYGVLRARGVTFRFFHRTTQLRLAAGDDRVAAIDLGVQARARDDYDPLVRVRGQPCWPNAPRWEQLEDGDELRGVDFESNLRPHAERRITLERGRDFDEVVLAIPAPVHRLIAEDLVARSDRYRLMLEHTHGVATAAMQLWLRPTLEELGWRGEAPLLTGSPGLFSSWGDMTETADSEDWPERPGTIAYFCDSYPEASLARDHAAGVARLRDEAAAWADRHLVRLWPGARTPDGRFDRDLLVVPPDARDPWAEQYFRLNTEPSERYILSLPGTTQYRLAPDANVFPNLVFAGDWTRTRINGGSVEAAVESGQVAADALRRRYDAD